VPPLPIPSAVWDKCPERLCYASASGMPPVTFIPLKQGTGAKPTWLSCLMSPARPSSESLPGYLRRHSRALAMDWVHMLTAAGAPTVHLVGETINANFVPISTSMEN
jgi:hypothetical protein